MNWIFALGPGPKIFTAANRPPCFNNQQYDFHVLIDIWKIIRKSLGIDFDILR